MYARRVLESVPNRPRVLMTAVLVVTLALALVAVRRGRSVAAELASARNLRSSQYVGSQQCKRCHAGHYASWQRTFHRTMTQEAGTRSVLGKFDGSTLDYMGVRARMHRGPLGEFLIDWSAGGAQRWQAQVVRTVGSHRYQQYLGKSADRYFRLPIAWDVEQRRFIHMNGAFLTPDPVLPAAGSSVERADYDRHVTRWNDNCVFCHNVHPNPGWDERRGQFTTQVAELGIACEACHGPGSQHVARNADPWRRYALHLTHVPDTSIRNPARLGARRSAEVCGRCHGQRISADIARVHRDGDPFIPGEELSAYSRPLAVDTTQNGVTGLFAPRFWRDGTARLTAYEYQGYLQSACRRSASFSCETCHAMHAGDPRAQLRPQREGDAACVACHSQFASTSARAAHSHHRADGPGGSCIACHMPSVVYGLVSVHLSHRIERPDPAQQARQGRPDACTLCHVDASRPWASSALAWWSRGANAGDSANTTASTPAVTEALLGGDPIERAVAAHALGQASAHFAPDYLGHVLGLLLDTLETDNYPAVRAIALRSLRAMLRRAHSPALHAVDCYEPTALPEARSSCLSQLRRVLGASAVVSADVDLRAALRARADTTAIEIGE